MLSGAHAEYDVDDLNRVRGQANYFANWQSGRFDYSFDALGRRKYEQRDWGTADGYQYNLRDELTGYKRDGDLNMDGTVSASFWNNTNLVYDNNGNRTQVTGVGADTYTVNSLNQYTNDSNTGTMGYDPKGNLTSAAGWIYTYDAQNRLTRMETGGTVIVQTYDPLNRVITRAVNGAITQNVWEGWNLIEEHRPDWSIQRCYLQGANQNEMVAAFDGGVYTNHWFWQDGRGNTSHITGDNAYLLERYTYDLSGAPKFYDEWGNERFGGSVYDTRFLFGGSQYLPDTGLYDMRNRFYDIALNRFLQTDPVGFAGDALNLYRYCHNDPVDRNDPMGLDYNIDHDGNDYIFSLGIHYYPENSAVNWDRSQEATFNHAIETGVKGSFILSDGRTVNVSTRVFHSRMNIVGIYEGHGASKTARSEGFWYRKGLPGGTAEFMALHEALHLLGVGDHYKRINGKIIPDHNYEHDVMGGVDGGVSGADISEIIKSNGKGAAGKLQGCPLYRHSISNGSSDIRWARNSGTGNWQADQATDSYVLGGGENWGEGFHPSGPN